MATATELMTENMIDKAEKTTETKTASSPKIKKNQRILIIDDNEMIHKDFKAVLGCGDKDETISVKEEEAAIFGNVQNLSEQDVFEIDSAFQGQEGLEKVQESMRKGRPYAMAFVDIRMPPGWDGIETIKRIWKEYPGLQVVVCTAYSDYSWHDMLKELGKTDRLLILKKPFDNMEVRQMACSLTEKWELLNNLDDMVRRQTHELELVVNKLNEVNHDLKDFVYIASHDLREPLRKISSFGELLRASLKDKLSEDDKENLKFMVDGANRMTKMIEALLVYSKVSKDKPVFEVVDLNEVIKQLRQVEVGAILEETGGTIEVTASLPKVWAESAQVGQLLQNLIANGIKYRGKGVKPRITIRVKNVSDDNVRVEVQDNGIGIKEEYYQEIFQMFRRLHSRQEYEGTGIGLAVCKKIVERFNGEIGVESKYGEGSTFWFTIPIAKETKLV
jgi:signal transduction histidine kinase